MQRSNEFYRMWDQAEEEREEFYRAWTEAEVWRDETEAVLEAVRLADASEEEWRIRRERLEMLQAQQVVLVDEAEAAHRAALEAEAVVYTQEMRALFEICAVCREVKTVGTYACCRFQNGICAECYANPLLTHCPTCRRPRAQMDRPACGVCFTLKPQMVELVCCRQENGILNGVCEECFTSPRFTHCPLCNAAKVDTMLALD